MSDWEERAEDGRRERAEDKARRRTPAKCREHRIALCPECFVLTDAALSLSTPSSSVEEGKGEGV